MAQPGPSDYRSRDTQYHSGGMMDHADTTAGGASQRAIGLAGDMVTTIKERPYTTLALAAGLAFAMGALWKLGRRQQPQSRLDALLAALPEMPSRENLVPRRWR
jgi:hypothetical protein